MKLKYITFAAASVFFIYSIVKYFKNSQKKDVMPLITEAAFSKTLLDVGAQKLHVPVTASFTIKNKGNEKLYIVKVEPDCHCTVADFSTAPIKPQDSSVIRLRYDSSNPGPFQSSATVTTNAINSPTLLVFRGTVN